MRRVPWSLGGGGRMRTRCEAAESEIDSEPTRLRALMLAEVVAGRHRRVAFKFFCISRARLARPSIEPNICHMSVSITARPAGRARGCFSAGKRAGAARGGDGAALELLALLHHPRETNVHV